MLNSKHQLTFESQKNMTRKKSWLARIDEIDRKDQVRLDRESNFDGAKTVFQKSKKRRPSKQAEQDKTLKLTLFVYVFFILEMCSLGGILLGGSGNSSLGSAIAMIFWSAILSILSMAIGIIALAMRPRLLYIHIPFAINCFIFLLIFIIFAF